MFLQIYASQFNSACPVGKSGGLAQNSYYMALDNAVGVWPTAMGLMVPPGILTDNPYGDEPKVFYCTVDTTREINTPQANGTSSGWGGPQLWMKSITRTTYMQNPTWRWGDAGATGVNPNNNPSFCIGYYDYTTKMSVTYPTPRRKIIPKLKDFKGKARRLRPADPEHVHEAGAQGRRQRAVRKLVRILGAPGDV